MSHRTLTKTRRHLPHWELPGSVYFITFRLRHGELTPAERRIVFDHIRAGDEKFYRLFAMIVMHDHVHLLAQPNPDVSLSRMTKGMKGTTARLLNQHRGTTGSLWQDESYDRIMRNTDEALEKADYIFDNPRRAGLTDDPSTYPYWYHRGIRNPPPP